MKKIYFFILIIITGIGGPVTAMAQLSSAFTATPTVGCSPIVVQFTDQSTGNPTGWSWDLGNGTVSSLQNPSTTYVTPGTYTITLTVSNGGASNTHTVTNYITVLAPPMVNFVVNDSTVSCPSKTVQFTNLSVSNGPGTPSYLWDFGDGGTSTQTNPTHTYTTVGSYNVSLSVTNGSGCTQSFTKQQYIQLVAKPVINFSASDTSFCHMPATVAFNNATVGGVNYTWSFGDGGTSTQANPTHTYNAAGTYTVQLIATNAAGCTDTLTKTAFIKVNNTSADFNVPNGTCVGNSLSFAAITSPAGGTSNWTFGDGGTATGDNVAHTYGTPGAYIVTLVYTINGCVDTATHTVNVTTAPVVDFSANSTYNCTAPFTVNFTNASTGATTYTWDFGDGGTSTQVNPSHTYNSQGSYTVTLVATNATGCSTTLVKANYIIVQPATATITATPPMGCAPADVLFTTNITPVITPVSYNINYGDGSNANVNGGWHTYTNAGVYNVTYTYTVSPGCSGTATTTVSLSTPAMPAFTSAPDTVCPGSPVSFTNQSTGATSYVWIFGDGGTSTEVNPSHTYSDPGLYTVKLVAINGFCADTLVKPDLVLVKLPLAAFTAALTNCANRFNFTFTNTSQGADTDHWDFGDGSTSDLTATTITHTYAAEGVYTVTLTITNSATGCSNVKTMVLPVFVPIDTFNASNTAICKGTNITFTGSVNTNSYYTNYAWDFGDGVTSTTNTNNTIDHIYNTPGTYTVTLTITDIYGCQTVLTKNAYIQVGGPGVGFSASPNQGCAGMTVNFTDQCYAGPGNTIVSRTWDLGDGNIITGNNTDFTHIYGAAGTFHVILTATDQIGCSSSNALNITTTKPTALFTADTATCLYGNTTFQNTSTGAVSYFWMFGDGTTSTDVSPVHVYNALGYYTVTLVATSAAGCTDTLVRTNYVHVTTFHASFALSDTFASCPPFAVSVTNTNPADIAIYAWTFGNGNTSVAANPSVLYTYPGVYAVKLVATNDIGCVDTATKHVTILGPTGNLSYGPENGCMPLTVTFTSNNQNTTSVSWDMNNGYTQTLPAGNTFSYTYTESGKYLPLIILSNGSCQVPVQGIDTIKVDGVAGDFTVSNICQGATASFYDTAYNSLTAVTRNWNFGDGATGNGHNATHVYATAGTFQVKLFLTNATGCTDTITHTIIVHALPAISAGPDQALCQGAPAVQLQATGGNAYSWSPATGLSCTNCANPTANPTNTTTYIITGTDSNTCVNTASVTVTLNAIPTVTTSANPSICLGSSTTIIAGGADTYVWTPATALSCTNCAAPVASPTATTTYTVTGTNASGCSNTNTVTVTVNALPVLTTSGDVAICQNTSANLQVNGATTYSWSPATGLSCTSCANPTANPTNTTTYTITGNNGTCGDTASITVTVNPLPTVNAGNATTLCMGSNEVLQVTGAASYVWTPATGLSCTNCSNPTASPTTTTTYIVTGTDTNGCSNTSNVSITVRPLPTVLAGNNAAICAGSSATLNASGAGSYVWTPATGLSCTNCASPIASPAATTIYSVTGTDGSGCSNTNTETVTVNPLPVVNAGNDTAICAGASTIFQATGATNYVWTPATGLSCTNCANPTANPANTTTYTISGTDGNGCTNTANVTLTVNALPVISAGANVFICGNSETSLQATGGTNYIWTPATGLSCTNCANPIANPGNTTTYTVTGNDGVCSNTATVTVNIHPIPQINAGSNVAICIGNNTTLQAQGGVSYTWTPATGLSCTNCANPVAAPTVTTSYVANGTDANGCSNTSTVTVTVNALPIIYAGVDTAVCPGLSVNLQATGGFSYVWGPVAGLSCTNCANPAANPATTTSYIVTGTDENSCSNKDTVVVTVHQQPNTQVPSQAICFGDTTQLQANGATTYSWVAATSLSCTNCANPVASPTVTTTYTVYGSTVFGCNDTTQVTVTVHALPVIHATENTPAICKGANANLSVNGAATYTWSPAISLSCTNCANPIAAPNDTTMYVVTGIDANGCKGTDSIALNIMNKPVVVVGPDQSICKGNTAQLQATGANTYSWTPATGLSCTNCANPDASPAAGTDYTIIGTSTNGCKDTTHVSVHLFGQPVISAGNDLALCAGSTSNLTATGAINYVWTPSTGLSCANCAAPVASPTVNTTYTVTGTDGNGCIDSAKLNIAVKQHVATAVGANDTVCMGGTAHLNAYGGVSYEWSPASSLSNETSANPAAQPSETTLYTVIITENECFTDTAHVLVVIDTIPTVELGADISIMAGNSIQLVPQTTGKVARYEWSPIATLSCANCMSPMATPTATTTYQLTVSTERGCSATDTVTIHMGCDKSQVFIPNTFTPNNDGVNDKFYASGKGITTINRFSVYDRWGELLYQATNIPIDDAKYGWDGTYKGEKLKPDVYVYIVSATCEAGSTMEYKGDISLIR